MAIHNGSVDLHEQPVLPHIEGYAEAQQQRILEELGCFGVYFAEYEIIFNSGLTINTRDEVVTVGGIDIPSQLTPREFDIMHMFSIKPGEHFSRQEIVDEIFGDNYSVHNVDVHVSNIKQKLGARERLPERGPNAGLFFVKRKRTGFGLTERVLRPEPLVYPQ